MASIPHRRLKMSVVMFDNPRQALNAVISAKTTIAVVKGYLDGFDVVCFHKDNSYIVANALTAVDQSFIPTEEGTRSDILWISVRTALEIETRF